MQVVLENLWKWNKRGGVLYKWGGGGGVGRDIQAFIFIFEVDATSS